MLKIKKYYFFKNISIKTLKRNVDTIYNLNTIINFFFKKHYYLIFNGYTYNYIRLNIVHTGYKFSQFVFTKKPFSGPIKKFKL